MATWFSRPIGYKFGVLLLFLGCLFFLIGFGSPYWCVFGHTSRIYRQTQYAMGLWMRCYGYNCASLGFHGIETWFRIVQTFQCIALIGFGCSCIFAIFDNFCRSVPRHTRVLEGIAGSCGILGFIADMVFTGQTRDWMSYYSSYGWGYALNLTGCIFIIISAVLILVFNRANTNTNTSSSGGTTGTVYYPPSSQVPAGSTVVVQQGYTYPPVVSYPGAAGGPPPQYPTGAPPMQYPLPQYTPGTAPQYSPQYPQTANTQGGYIVSPPPQAGYSAASYSQGYSGGPQEKQSLQ